MKRWHLIVIIVTFVFLILSIPFLQKTSKTWNFRGLPLDGKVIVLDAGHGGPDGGASGGDVIEKVVALSITNKLRDYLQGQGATVIMTRDGDYDLAEDGMKGYSRRKSVDLRKRVEIINGSNADLYISIHLNSLPRTSSKGAQTFFYGSLIENERFAKYVQAELRESLNNTHRLAKIINHVYLMKYAKVPGALVEVGFLSNYEESQQLRDDEYQDKLAAAIYRGVIRYYTDKNEPPN
ncbi:N-acetylmuramoyl-L-alanine amidase CwlD [Bacillus sp. AFS055030]|uniref:N-acetylmuramoyl-L-alanine amidase CwlD n=1 Tax=Bacillus sp. AFS055030 TaxID=2033507 RepID=UPI000BFCD1DF|nr:N-acetylmuramoyl-L-alanine amidase CwlD [Bacillus sp. AFS055030]PGL67670.1 N-acetylmuramoyl-L-alanine amidase CwlD [Bacillus sp. AFS055030]